MILGAGTFAILHLRNEITLGSAAILFMTFAFQFARCDYWLRRGDVWRAYLVPVGYHAIWNLGVLTL
jgi:membrane protease YdiL (CAAX protease family)